MSTLCHIVEQDRYNAEEIARRIYDYIDITDVKKVFIKPNLVIDPSKGEEDRWIATVTNISLIEAVLIVLREKANNSSLEVTIGDAPMARTNIQVVLKLNGLLDIIEKYQAENMKVKFIDIREWYWKYISGMCVARKRLHGDPLGKVLVNLECDSAFWGKECLNFEAFDNINPIGTFHNENDNIYSISKSVLDCDLFINLPKMKTHRIAGMTCAMKNLVGINSNKNCVPHNTVGNSTNGGDESPDNPSIALNESSGIGGIARRVIRLKIPAINYLFIPVKKVYERFKHSTSEKKIGYGMWYGNDTIWRSIIDLNRLLLYSDNMGVIHDKKQRRYLCITDAIVSGEGEGPLTPTPKKTNLLLIANNAVTNDSVACQLMGLDYKKIPSIYNSYTSYNRLNLVDFKHDDIEVVFREKTIKITELRKHYSFQFAPTAGWKGHIELDLT